MPGPMPEMTPEKTPPKLPFRSLFLFNNLLLAAFLLFGGLRIARDFLLPVVLAALFAMLILPLVRRFESWRIGRIIAILVALFLVFSLATVLFQVIKGQLTQMAEDLPQFQAKFQRFAEQFQNWISDAFNLSDRQQERYLQRLSDRIFQSAGSGIAGLLAFTVEFAIKFMLVVVYTFLFLLLRERLRNGILMLVHGERRRRWARITDSVSRVANQYLVGVFLVVAILAVLNTTGLLILGIPYAVFLGVLAGFLNIVPYVGTISGSIFPVLVAIAVKDTLFHPVAVALWFTAVQLAESYLFTPKIAASKVQLNPLAAILALMIGFSVWEISGMVLALPLLGIAKVVFDKVGPLKPYGYLIGKGPADEVDPTIEGKDEGASRRGD